MEEIRQWMKEENPDFDQGFTLFCKYSRQESLIRFISRKRDMVALRYQLEKILKYNPKPNPFAKKNFARYLVAHTPAQQQSEEPKDVRLVVERELKVKLEDLPEDLQKVYLKILDDYKKQRIVHEKMKLANSNTGRAEFREDLLKLASEIKAGWAILDGKQSNHIETKVIPQASKINSARAFITKAIKKESLTKQQREGIKTRLELILSSGEHLSKETLAKLKKHGF